MFDTLLDGLIGVFDLAIELIHLGLDVIEYSIELILEYTIHTGHQESEIIIINSALIIMLYMLYRAFFAAPGICRRLIRKYKAARLLRKRRRASQWKSMLLASKIKLISAYIFGVFCLLFLVTL
ncbi:MAG: hypothetical protein KAH20_08235 [Methylococcales bacterium]|nr:hypothetical protein [Methylococcales bacterium]